MSAAATPPPAERQNPGLSNWMTGLPSISDAPAPKPAETPAAPAPEPSKPAATPPPEPTKAPDKVEPAKEPEKVVEGDSGEKWPRSAKDWDAFKAKRKEKEEALAKERDEIRVERDKIKAEIETLRGQGPSPELETLKKERDEFERQLRIHAVENHPKFKAYFDNKTNAQIELAKKIVGSEHAEAITKALSLPESEYRDGKIQELAEALDPLKQARLGSVINSLSQIQEERSSEIAKSRENFDQMQAEQKTSGERAQAEAVKAATDAINTALAQASDPKTGLFLYQKKDGNEAWNKEVDARVQTFKHLALGNATMQQRAQACRDAAAFPAVLKYAQERDVEVIKLTEQVKALSAAQPSAAGKGNATPENNGSPAPMKVKTGMRPMDVSKEWISSMQGEWQR